jgi:hypothetical protein
MSDARNVFLNKAAACTCTEEGEECASGEFVAEILCIPELLADQLSNVHVAVEMARLSSMQNPRMWSYTPSRSRVLFQILVWGR